MTVTSCLAITLYLTELIRMRVCCCLHVQGNTLSAELSFKELIFDSYCRKQVHKSDILAATVTIYDRCFRLTHGISSVTQTNGDAINDISTIYYNILARVSSVI